MQLRRVRPRTRRSAVWRPARRGTLPIGVGGQQRSAPRRRQPVGPSPVRPRRRARARPRRPAVRVRRRGPAGRGGSGSGRSSSVVRVVTAAVRTTPQRRAGRSSAGKAGVEGGFEDVAGERLDRGVGAGEHRVAAAARAGPRRTAAGRRGRAARRRAARAAGRRVVAVNPSSTLWSHGGPQRAPELARRSARRSAWVPSAGADLGDLGGDLVGLDAVLGVLGARLASPLGRALPLAVQARRVSLDVEAEVELLLHRSRPRSSSPSSSASITASLLSGTGTETPVALRIASCLRSSTSSTMPSIWLSPP